MQDKDVLLMLGEMRSDIKTLLKRTDEFGPRIDALETKETSRIARASVFGLFGGFLANGVWQMLRSKIGF